jgi:NhaP-type Na+/H+ or K+/H+ antiporter
MPSRFAASLAILAFAICLVVGAFQADNPFGTTITRALVAMVGTLVVGTVVGWAGQKMIDERIGQIKASSDKMAEGEKPSADR